MRFRKIQSTLGGWIRSIGATHLTGGGTMNAAARMECQMGKGPGLQSIDTTNNKGNTAGFPEFPLHESRQRNGKM